VSDLQLSAVLLAGGESQRMGRDKATIDLSGTPLWHTQVATLTQLKPLEIFVSARTDPPWRPGETIFVADQSPSVGPLSGIVAALRRMRGTHLLVLAIDLPFMTPQYLQTLRPECRIGIGAVPKIRDRAEPLAAIYPVEATAEFANALSGSDHSLQSVVRNLEKAGKLGAIVVPEQNATLFRNLNSPTDLN
jgi:molybdopterin-guanine dinucleotide biosynthesis protein A